MLTDAKKLLNLLRVQGYNMKEFSVKKYKCEICDHVYDNQNDAELCESKSISQDKGVKVGDTVFITGGEGKGSMAKVRSVYIVDMNWGHYAWERYWHTVSLTADVIEGFGSRLLTFDQYEKNKT